MGLEQFSKFGTGISGIAGAGMSLIGGIGSAIQGRKNRKLARELQQQQLMWQREENERAYQRNIEMWNMQNAYNSPAAQMQRLVEAGLNPNLAYGSLGSSTADGAPQYQPANVPAISDAAFTDPWQGISQAGQSSLQYAQTDLLRAQAEKTREDTKGVTLDNIRKKIENSNLDAIQKSTIQKILSEVKVNDAQLPILSAELEEIQVRTNERRKNIDNLIEQKRILKAQGDIAEYDAKVHKFFKSEEWRQMCAKSDMDETQARYIGRILESQLLSASDNHEMIQLQIDKELYEREFRNLNKWDDYNMRIQETRARHAKGEADTYKYKGETEKNKAFSATDSERYNAPWYHPIWILNTAEYLLSSASGAILSKLLVY